MINRLHNRWFIILFVSSSCLSGMQKSLPQLRIDLQKSFQTLDRQAFKQALNEYTLYTDQFIHDYQDESTLLHAIAYRPDTINDHEKVLAVLWATAAVVPLCGLSYWYTDPLSIDGAAAGIFSCVSLHLLYASYHQLSEDILERKNDLSKAVHTMVPKVVAKKKCAEIEKGWS